MIMKNFLQETYGLPQKRCFLHPPHIVLLAFFGDSSCFLSSAQCFLPRKIQFFLILFLSLPSSYKTYHIR